VSEAATVERLSNPYAKAFILLGCPAVISYLIVYETPYLDDLRVACAYLCAPLLAAFLVLAVAFYRQGSNPVSKLPLISGIAFVVGGIVLDRVSTVIESPTLARERNPIWRALLDAEHSLAFVHIYTLACQMLLAALICILWAAFLRHRLTLITSAMTTQPKSRLEFVRAAMGGSPRPSWRQFLLPLARSDFSKSYHTLLTLSAIVTGAMMFRWYCGLSNFGLIRTSPVVALFISILVSATAYFVWLSLQYTEDTGSTTG